MDICTVWVFLWTYLSCNIVAPLSKIACRDGADGSLTRPVYVRPKTGMNLTVG